MTKRKFMRNTPNKTKKEVLDIITQYPNIDIIELVVLHKNKYPEYIGKFNHIKTLYDVRSYLAHIGAIKKTGTTTGQSPLSRYSATGTEFSELDQLKAEKERKINLISKLTFILEQIENEIKLLESAPVASEALPKEPLAAAVQAGCPLASEAVSD